MASLQRRWLFVFARSIATRRSHLGFLMKKRLPQAKALAETVAFCLREEHSDAAISFGSSDESYICTDS